MLCRNTTATPYRLRAAHVLHAAQKLRKAARCHCHQLTRMSAYVDHCQAYPTAHTSEVKPWKDARKGAAAVRSNCLKDCIHTGMLEATVSFEIICGDSGSDGQTHFRARTSRPVREMLHSVEHVDIGRALSIPLVVCELACSDRCEAHSPRQLEAGNLTQQIRSRITPTGLPSPAQ